MIELGKQYVTRDGREVRIYATDGGGEYPVHGAIKYDGGWFSRCWAAKGAMFLDYQHSSGDLIEVKPRIQREVSATGTLAAALSGDKQ